MASKIVTEKGNLQVSGAWGEVLFPPHATQPPPLTRLALQLGLSPMATLEQVRATVANKSWDGTRWVDDPPAG